MKKIIKFFCFFIFLILFCTTPLIYKGYQSYKKAIQEVSILEKQKQIQEKEFYTSFKELPKIYLDAVIAVEDHRFYKHSGIDIIAITRAFLTDLKAMEFLEGGSTITQQLAKNMYFTQEKTITRKIAETFMAFKIEKTLTKEEILELYLNTSYFGDGYYTVKEASLGYFKKEPNEMTDYEATLLAGIPNAPSVYSPTNNLELSKQRQKQVIQKMIKYHYLTNEQANQILKEQ